MAIEWTENLAVGVENIDEQHKVLFEKVNELLEACSLGQGKTVIGDTIIFLGEYTKKHFNDEEKYMLSINYPEYNKQKELHTNFISELEKINNDYMETGNKLLLTISVNSMVVKWLTYHISIEDKKIGEFEKSL